MPNYDYKCLECNFTFEEFQKMTDKPLEVCPKCNGQLKRLIGSGMGPIFKGTGFYQTDYKKTSTPKTATGKSTASTTKQATSQNSEKKESSSKKEKS
ncbi:MAG: FmdB family transcriptional regulator [Ignavibacteriae bacterium]|nr:MAG: FmdB family transcriptional regulator [Ignavibacteriota bacterium]